MTRKRSAALLRIIWYRLRNDIHQFTKAPKIAYAMWPRCIEHQRQGALRLVLKYDMVEVARDDIESFILACKMSAKTCFTKYEHATHVRFHVGGQLNPHIPMASPFIIILSAFEQ